MYQPGISVVIPNYNGQKLLPEILPPLFRALEQSGMPWEVIVSDDCSTDESVSWLQKNQPKVTVLTSDVNRGFSPTINSGIFATRYAYILLLNSDVKLTDGYFGKLLPYFNDPLCFGVMGRIVGWEDEVMQDGAKYPAFHGAKIKTSGNYYVPDAQPGDRVLSMYLSGANAFVSADKIRKLGGFDELFAPFYVEDFELSLRAWRLGWYCYYEHQAVCRHKLSVSIKSKSSKAAINTVYYRNKMFMHAIHLEGMRLFFWYCQLLPEMLIRIFSGRFYYLRSLAFFFSNRKRMLESRQKFLALAAETGRLKSVPEIVRMIIQKASSQNIKRF